MHILPDLISFSSELKVLTFTSQVCTLEPLKVGAYPGHPLGHHSILALATISKVIVITVR